MGAFPKEGFCIGHEREDGKISFYAARTDPEILGDYKTASRIAKMLNDDESSRKAAGQQTEWVVYTMKFEKHK